MATILPAQPAGACTPEKLRVFQALKGLPDEVTVWQRLTVAHAGGPDFWVRLADGRSLLIAVAAATIAEVRAARQGRMFEQAELPGAAEEQALCAFIAGLAPGDALPGVVLFPGVPRADLERALDPLPPGISRGAKEDLAPDHWPAWLAAQAGTGLAFSQEEALRRVFTPEVIIPPALTVRAPLDRATGAGLTGYLLSYNQEQVLKYDLDLSDEAEAASEDLRLQLVNGVTGSGKSLVLLYRARLLRQYFPRKRMLVLTHNRALIRDLRQRYLLLTGGDQGVDWHTFQGWCWAHWPPGEPAPRLASLEERRTLIAAVHHQYLADTAISPELLQNEIDWLKDRLITTRQGYLEADRAGRGFGLSEAMRARVYTAIHAYQEALHARGRLDFGDIPRRIWRALLEQGDAFPQYDVVLVDEAQFFAPIWFEIIKRVITPERGQLFMVADPTQGFLRRRQSWLASGLHVRGHTRRLEQPYRTTRAILDFATSFYQLRLPGDDEALFSADLRQTADGLPPELVALPAEQDEAARVVNEVRALVERGVPLAHILVIHADWQGAWRMLERLQAHFGAAHVAHPRHLNAPMAHLRVCQLDAATGLESPIVFLMGTHRLLEAEDSLRIAEEERAERVRDNTRRLYMAMTRAGQRLVITCTGQVPGVFRQAAASARVEPAGH